MGDRDAQGRYKKGHSGGPGRPPKERVEKYYAIGMTACTFAKWKRIIKRAADDAENGDHQARRFLADYLMGQPVKRTEITGPDGGPLLGEPIGDTRDRLLASLSAKVCDGETKDDDSTE